MSSQPPVTPPANPNPQVTPTPRVNRQEETPEAHRVRSAAFWIIIVALLILWLIGWLLRYCVPWIHLLPIVALAAALVELFTGNSKNIDAHSDDIPNWDPARPEASLTEIHLYVLQEAAKSTQWYWKNKGSKAMLSRIIRFVVWALAAVGGLLPIIAVLLQDYSNVDLTNGLWASLLLGIAAALLGLDKGFGFSSGWARYVLTATNIRKSLEEFRLDWTVLRAKAGDNLTAENVSPLIERAKQFRSDVEALVLQETKDWVTEFQSTMQQMEKDVAAQLSTLKAQVDKTIQEKVAAAKPGFVQLTIKDPNNKFANANLKVTLIDSNNQAVQGVQQQPVTNLVWPSPFVPPGTYQVKVEGTVNNVQFSQTRSVMVKSGEMATPAPPDIAL